MSRGKYFNLYFVETPAPEENCFVAALSKKDAERLEENGSGFNLGDCEATRILRLEADFVSKHTDENSSSKFAFYVQDDDLEEFGIIASVQEGDVFFETAAGTFEDRDLKITLHPFKQTSIKLTNIIL